MMTRSASRECLKNSHGVRSIIARPATPDEERQFSGNRGKFVKTNIEAIVATRGTGLGILKTMSADTLPATSLEEKKAAYTEAHRSYWDQFAASIERWQPVRGYYQRRLSEVCRNLIPPGMRVLEVGCGQGDLLASVKPAVGYGIDFAPAGIARARRRYPEFTFIEADAHDFDLGTTFDYIICSDLVNDVWDVQTVFENVARHCRPDTRLVLNCYNRIWERPRSLAAKLGLVVPLLTQNWLTGADLVNLLYLGGFEAIRLSPEILWPLRTPLLDTLANRFLVKLWPFHLFSLTNVMVARLAAAPPVSPEPVVTVVVAARNEEGNIPHIFERIPQMGAGTELIFVEGNSTDRTFEAIEREIERHPEINARLYKQPGKGKGDAVRTGFHEAAGEVLMILDADLTVAPEDLPRFYEAWRSGKAEFVNGVRLVYPMEEHAMRFFNHLGNRFFSFAFTWLLGQNIKDTLCGTKVLSNRSYEIIAANRAYFGEVDPFGDFDLLFGAARYNLKIVDLPVRYGERVYGETNIQRWRHGLLLLRMVMLAMRRLKFI
jgi:SAM-dependent methyltransferase